MRTRSVLFFLIFLALSGCSSPSREPESVPSPCPSGKTCHKAPEVYPALEGE